MTGDLEEKIARAFYTRFRVTLHVSELAALAALSIIAEEGW